MLAIFTKELQFKHIIWLIYTSLQYTMAQLQLISVRNYRWWLNGVGSVYDCSISLRVVIAQALCFSLDCANKSHIHQYRSLKSVHIQSVLTSHDRINNANETVPPGTHSLLAQTSRRFRSFAFIDMPVEADWQHLRCTIIISVLSNYLI